MKIEEGQFVILKNGKVCVGEVAFDSIIFMGVELETRVRFALNVYDIAEIITKETHPEHWL